MRYFSLVFVFVTTMACGAVVTEDGVDALGLHLDGLNGSGVRIGQTEGFRSGKAMYDMDENSSSNTIPAHVYFQGVGGEAPQNQYMSLHATIVAQQMIGTGGLWSGVSPAAELHSIGVGDTDDDFLIGSALNRLALLESGTVRAINMSFSLEIAFGPANGNSQLTLFVDWSARRHDVLYVAAWGNILWPDEFRKPQDNFNGITVAASERIDDGPYTKASIVNWPETNSSDAQRIDILAPGRNVNILPWNEFPATEDGTSLSAPHVTGAVALLQQHAQMQMDPPISNPRFDTDSQRHEVMKAVLLNSADKLAGVHGSNRTVVDMMGLNWRQSEAFVSDEIALDDEMGAGHLNVRRAVEQLAPGEFDPGMVDSIGWDYHTIGGAGSTNEYIFNGNIGGGYIAVTLTWDRQVELTDPDGTYTYGDMFFVEPLEENLNNLDVYLMPVNSNDFNDAVAKSVGFDDSVEHIFFDNFDPGAYKLVVHNNFFMGMGDVGNYALAWWFGDPATPAPGDYNGDGMINSADYDTWRSTFGNSVSAGSGADGNGNGMIDAADYVVWRDNLSAGSGNLAAVPEPGTFSLFTLATAFFVIRRPRQGKFIAPVTTC